MLRTPRNSGHILIVALCVLSVLAILSGVVMSLMSAHYRTVWRTAAWHEALLTAESGIDMTIAEITGLLPDIQINSQTGVALGASPLNPQLVNGLSLKTGGLSLKDSLLSLSITPPALTHGGDGATTSSATVTIDVLNLNDVLSPNLLSGALNLLTSGTPPNINILRLRSTGTVILPTGSRLADLSSLDTQLLRTSLVHDPNTGHAVTQPYVARSIEVMLKPVFPFQNGLATGGGITAPNSSSVFDSFSSASALTSTNYVYDPAKRRSNITVATDSAAFNVAGNVYGNVSTDGGSVVKGTQISGTVNNSYYQPMPSLSVPSWSAPGSPASGTTTIAGGALLTPAHYSYSQVTGTLHVTGSLLGGLGLGGLLGSVPVVGSLVSSEADVYVSGNFSGTIIVDPGVNVHLYVAGNVTLAAGAVQNNSKLASELLIMGVPGSLSVPTMNIDTTGNVIASIYAPDHKVTLTGNGDFSGSLTASQLTISGNSNFHYDESLALQIGPVLGYSLVSWREVTPQ